MAMWLRQSTASQEILLGPFVDSTDGNTQKTALTIANTDIKLWKDGATTLADKNSGGATHIANGRYYAVLDATDTNTLGKLEVLVHVSGALAVRREYMVLAAAVYDTLVTNGTLASTTSGRTIVTDAAGLVDANTVKLGPSGTGTAQTARDIGASVLLSSGTGTGQLDFTSGVVKANVTQFGGTNATTSGGRPEVNSTHWAGSAITATSIPVGTAAGASGGLLISGSNSGTTTFGALTVTGATTFTGAITGTNASNDFRVNGVAPGASGGLHINGSNSGTTTYAALTVTGAFTVSGGIAVSQSTTNGHGISVTGNGTGNAVRITHDGAASAALHVQNTGGDVAAWFQAAISGEGTITATNTDAGGYGIMGLGNAVGIGGVANSTTGHGIVATGGSSGNGLQCTGSIGGLFQTSGTNQPGLKATGVGSGAGAHFVGGTTGSGLLGVGGSSSGDGIRGNTTGGVGISVAGTQVSTLTAAQVNTEADTALADVGLTTTVTGRIDAAISTRLASSSISLSGGAVTVGTNNDKTGYSLTQSFPTNFSSLAITAGGAVTAGTVSDKTGYSLASGDVTNAATRFLTMIELDGSVYRYTTNALEQGPSGAGSSDYLATGTVASTTGGTTTLDSGSTANADYHTGSLLVLTSGTGAGQERIITAWSAGRVATHADWDVNPDNATTYQIRTGRSSATVTGSGDATAANQTTIIKLIQAKRR